MVLPGDFFAGAADFFAAGDFAADFAAGFPAGFPAATDFFPSAAFFADTDRFAGAAFAGAGADLFAGGTLPRFSAAAREARSDSPTLTSEGFCRA